MSQSIFVNIATGVLWIEVNLMCCLTNLHHNERIYNVYTIIFFFHFSKLFWLHYQNIPQLPPKRPHKPEKIEHWTSRKKMIPRFLVLVVLTSVNWKESYVIINCFAIVISVFGIIQQSAEAVLHIFFWYSAGSLYWAWFYKTWQCYKGHFMNKYCWFLILCEYLISRFYRYA